jgi:glucose uptake protein
MILPATYTTVLILLCVSLFCLGTWINAFKAAGSKWRFELFSIDFGLGALIAAIAAAYTLGVLGSDLGFSDRLLVAGRTAQALALLAGAVFNLGNMLLLACVSLLGIASAFPLCIGIALIVSSCFDFRPPGMYYFLAGDILILITVFLELRAGRLREAAMAVNKPPAPKPHSATAHVEHIPAKATVAAAHATNPLKTPSHRTSSGRSRSSKRAASKPISRRTVRGITAGLVGGTALGFFTILLQNSLPGDIGLGPYAAMLLFAIGVFGSTIVYNFYFLNIAIEGQSLTFASYFQGTKGQHVLGVLAGVMCMAGLLAATIAVQSSSPAEMPKLLQILLPLLCVPLACFYAVTFWKELRVPAKSRFALLLGLVLFLCSLGLFAYGFAGH